MEQVPCNVCGKGILAPHSQCGYVIALCEEVEQLGNTIERIDTAKDRLKIIQTLTDKWCLLCGAANPCYCDPFYDN